jgi:hypothetical protein
MSSDKTTAPATTNILDTSEHIVPSGADGTTFGGEAVSTTRTGRDDAAA